MMSVNLAMAIFLCFMLIVGIVGSLLNLIVFSNRKLFKMPTFRLLFYMSLVDFFILVFCTSLAYLEFAYSIQIRLFSIFTCRLSTFLTYFLTHLSSLLMSAVSIERVYVVCNLSIASKFFSKRLNDDTNNTKSTTTAIVNNHRIEIINVFQKVFKSKRIEKWISCFVVGLFILNFHFLCFLTINENRTSIGENINNHTSLKMNINYYDDYENKIKEFDLAFSKAKKNITTFLKVNETLESTRSSLTTDFICYAPAESNYENFLVNYWIWIDSFCFSWAPLLVMFYCSILILKKSRKNNINMIAIKKQGTTSQTNTNKSIKLRTNYTKRNNQLAITLILTQILFIVCTLPFSITSISLKYERIQTDSFIMILAHALTYLKNSSNFFLYVISSQMYRQVLVNRCIYYGSCCNNSKRNKNAPKIVRKQLQIRKEFKNNNKNTNNNSKNCNGLSKKNSFYMKKMSNYNSITKTKNHVDLITSL